MNAPACLLSFVTLRALLTVSESVLALKVHLIFFSLGRWFRN